MEDREEGRLAKRAAQHGAEGASWLPHVSGLRGPQLQGGGKPQIIQISQLSQHSQPFADTMARAHFALPMPLNGQVADL